MMSLFPSVQSIYAIFFLTGFTVGFGHCIGMCGPIAVSVSFSGKGGKSLLPHALYNGGRIITYTLLGGIMGFSGSFTRAIPVVMIQKAVLILTGLFVAAMGLGMMGILPRIRMFTDDAGSGGVLTKVFRHFSQKPSRFAYLPLGMLLGFLPCGLIYTALVAAARAGMEAKFPLSGALTGMGAMFCFGLGTAPALLLVGKLAGIGMMKWRSLVYRLGGILMTGMGLYFVYKAVR